MRDKWPIEHTLDLLDPLLAEKHAVPVSTRDWLWIFAAAAAGLFIIWADFHGLP